MNQTNGQAHEATERKSVRLYIGAYTQFAGKGIYRSWLNVETGELTAPELAAETVSASFLAFHPSKPCLYVTNEVNEFRGEKTGAVSAFAIERQTGDLKLLNQQPTGGAIPCHLIVDATGKWVLVVNYTGGNVAVLPIQDDGSLGQPTTLIQHQGSSANPKRQEAPHPHSINLDPRNRFAFVADLGVDKIFIYRFDSSDGTLTPHDPPHVSLAPGSGPRHFTFHPNGRWAYVINELSSTIVAFRYDADRGRLEPMQTVSTLPDDFQGESYTSEIAVHPSGRFLYGSNRGHNSIAVFRIDPETGKLTALGCEPSQGEWPRNFVIDRDGRFLVAGNRVSGNVVVFRINRDTGTLQPTGHSIRAGAPACVRILPSTNQPHPSE
ncbi:MAG: lactonase family protein [Planctomycetes bacterium]|nr:lactonase family protein [Planctomycetota bacterium]